MVTTTQLSRHSRHCRCLTAVVLAESRPRYRRSDLNNGTSHTSHAAEGVSFPVQRTGTSIIIVLLIFFPLGEPFAPVEGAEH